MTTKNKAMQMNIMPIALVHSFTSLFLSLIVLVLCFTKTGYASMILRKKGPRSLRDISAGGAQVSSVTTLTQVASGPIRLRPRSMPTALPDYRVATNRGVC